MAECGKEKGINATLVIFLLFDFIDMESMSFKFGDEIFILK